MSWRHHSSGTWTLQYRSWRKIETHSAPLWETFSVIITLRYIITCRIHLFRSCSKRTSINVDAKMKALIDKNTTESDVIIYTNGLVVQIKCRAWAFPVQMGGKTVTEEISQIAKIIKKHPPHMLTEWPYEHAPQSANRCDSLTMGRIVTEFQDTTDNIYFHAWTCQQKWEWVSRLFGQHCNSDGEQINGLGWHTHSLEKPCSSRKPPHVQGTITIKDAGNANQDQLSSHRRQ